MEFDHELDQAQKDAVELMLRPESDGGALLAFDVGLGKTRTGLMFARAYNAKVILVVVPLSTVDDWIAATPVEYPGMTARQIDSTTAGKKALADFQWGKNGVYIVGHTYWERLAWNQQLIKKQRKTDPDKYRKVDSHIWSGKYDLLIFDESHMTANYQSWTHKACMNLLPFHEGGPFRLAMSGTFAGDRFDGAYGATRWVWPHRHDIIHPNYFDWTARWAATKYDKFKPRNQAVTGEREPGEFVSSLPCYIRMESDLPPAKIIDAWCTLYPEQRRVYDELDDRMVAWIEENPMVAEYSITKRIRQRQTTLALPTLHFEIDPETGIEELVEVGFEDGAESVKTDLIFAMIDGTDSQIGDLMVGERVLFLTDSQKYARLLTDALNARYGDVAREWSGKITKPQRKINKAEFISGKIRYIVGVQSAMGTGTNGLQHVCHIGVMVSRADRRITNEQGIGRLRRKGQEKDVYWINLLAEDTVDTGQLSAQMEAALKMQKTLRAKRKAEERGAVG